MKLLRAMTIAAGAVFAAVVGVASAHAVTFNGSFGVTQLNTTDPGLVVAVSPTSGGLGFDLPNAGNSTTFGLFDIWTDETSVNADDRVAKPISVNFTFTSPAASGNVGGNTLGGSLLGIFQFGRVVWGAPLLLPFGDGGQLLITLSDETFN